MSIRTNLPVCLNCRTAAGLTSCAGACACKADGRDIIDHAKSGECPFGKFGGAATPSTPRAGLPPGVGGVLKQKLMALRIGETQGCGCAAFAKEMDRWGPDECGRRADEVVAKMLGEAGKRWWGKALLALAPGLAEAKVRAMLAESIAEVRGHDTSRGATTS